MLFHLTILKSNKLQLQELRPPTMPFGLVFETANEGSLIMAKRKKPDKFRLGVHEATGNRLPSTSVNGLGEPASEGAGVLRGSAPRPRDRGRGRAANPATIRHRCRPRGVERRFRIRKGEFGGRLVAGAVERNGLDRWPGRQPWRLRRTTRGTAISNKLASLAGKVGTDDNRPSDAAEQVRKELNEQLDAQLAKLRLFLAEDLKKFNDLLGKK
jgi:hypothetical protein